MICLESINDVCSKKQKSYFMFSNWFNFPHAQALFSHQQWRWPRVLHRFGEIIEWLMIPVALMRYGWSKSDPSSLHRYKKYNTFCSFKTIREFFENPLTYCGIKPFLIKQGLDIFTYGSLLPKRVEITIQNCWHIWQVPVIKTHYVRVLHGNYHGRWYAREGMT